MLGGKRGKKNGGKLHKKRGKRPYKCIFFGYKLQKQAQNRVTVYMKYGTGSEIALRNSIFGITKKLLRIGTCRTVREEFVSA